MNNIIFINARSRQPSTRSLFVKLAETFKTNRPPFVDYAHALPSQREKALTIQYFFFLKSTSLKKQS